jgi:hypothetical protein
MLSGSLEARPYAMSLRPFLTHPLVAEGIDLPRENFHNIPLV